MTEQIARNETNRECRVLLSGAFLPLITDSTL
jgi:hypothetical protein